MPISRLCTAIHEAGHAVAQLANPPHPWIDSIEIDGLSADLLGIVNTPAMWQPYMGELPAPAEIVELWRKLAWKDIIQYLAGPIAELRWKRYSRATIWFGWKQFADQCLGEPPPELRTDFGLVRARLRWAHAGREQKAFCEGWLASEDVVAKHWRQIKAVGRLLCERGRLSDTELLEIWEAVR